MRKNRSRKSKRTRSPSSLKAFQPLSVFQTLMFGVGFYVICLLGGDSMSGSLAHAQNTATSSRASLPFRPIGSESAVDRYRSQQGNANAASSTGSFRQTAYQSQRSQANNTVRQVAMQSGGFALPQGTLPQGTLPQGMGGRSQPSTGPNQFTAPPLDMPPALQPQTMPQQPPRLQPAPPPLRPSAPPLSSSPTVPNEFRPQNSLPANSPAPRSLQPYQAPPLADYQPVAPPQITNGGFATMGDCRLITPPSNYTAMSPYGVSGGCGVSPASFSGPYVPPPAQIAAPATMPPTGMTPFTQAPGAPASGGLATAAPVGSLMTFGQENYPVQVGQGLWGQPVAYVPGQSFRNWLRYLSF